MAIEVGKTYINTDLDAYPESMRGASVTITSIDDTATQNQLSVAYSFIDASGCTGEGTMQLSYAEEFLKVKSPSQKFDCTVYDKSEGKIHVTVTADNEEAAYEEAGVAAAERGCSNVTEIVVGVFE